MKRSLKKIDGLGGDGLGGRGYHKLAIRISIALQVHHTLPGDEKPIFSFEFFSRHSLSPNVDSVFLETTGRVIPNLVLDPTNCDRKSFCLNF